MPRPKKFAKEYNKKTKDPITEAFLKTKAAGDLIQDVADKIKKQGGSPSETTSEKVYTKAIKEVRKIIGGGAELRGGGRAVMKKGGKV
jgi:hypothetical protein